MAKTRATRRRRPRPTAEDVLLDAFFNAWSREGAREIANAINGGCITGAALVRKLEWTPDKVSRRTDELRSGGIVAKRRDNGWIRTTLTTEGVEAARRWAQPLEALTSSDPPPPAWSPKEWTPASGALASKDRRRLLTQLVTTPGATQSDLVASCALPQPTVSRGLKELKEAGLVEVHRDGGRARHHLTSVAVAGLKAWLEAFAAKLAESARVSGDVVLPKAGKPSSQAAAPAEAPSPPVTTIAVQAAAPEGPASQELNDNEPVGAGDDASAAGDAGTPADATSDAA